MKKGSDWEGMGAASGLLAALSFVLAFAALMSTDPTGSPPLPAVQNAEQAPAYIAANLNVYRLELLFISLGVVFFLWFMGSLWVRFKSAEGDPGRASMLVVIGASVGAAMMLVGLVLGFTSGLSTSSLQADTVPSLYTAGALLFAFGGGALALFFFGVAKVILGTEAMARWLGVFAFIAALLCVFAFVTPFFDSGVMNAATGALGRWAWYAAFVVWVFLASLMLTIDERRLSKAAESPEPPEVPGPQTGTEGELR